ncbi:hypothetical protein J437_LFUL017861 [Ladona fulva]|uniref:Uncharacterized protein n=1 Tax=Ladona fulva TaxID=123851 RepID=A0A8K0P990_LADFU|nr:hypothetical protein J437_LFUL017861 [Ladona fulva]
MKFCIALVLALAVAASALPQFTAPRVVQILQKDEVRDEAGNYRLSYVSEDGTKLSESGRLVPNAEGDDQVLVKEGSYSFVTPEGRTYSVQYVADEQGFRPVGEHIPRA